MSRETKKEKERLGPGSTWSIGSGLRSPSQARGGIIVVRQPFEGRRNRSVAQGATAQAGQDQEDN